VCVSCVSEWFVWDVRVCCLGVCARGYVFGTFAVRECGISVCVCVC